MTSNSVNIETFLPQQPVVSLFLSYCRFLCERLVLNDRDEADETFNSLG